MYIRLCALAPALTLVLVLVLGCSTGGSGPRTATPKEVLNQAQLELESVTTNLDTNPDTASSTLRTAARDFATVLQQDPNNAQAKLGYALSNTLVGFYDLTSVLPKSVKTYLMTAITAARGRGDAVSPLSTLSELATHALSYESRTTVRDVQLRIASRTLDTVKNSLTFFDQVETATASGAGLYLRLYEGGRIRTVVLCTADVQLVSAFANLVEAMLNLSISFNLDMPNGTPMRPLPVDGNDNGMLEANEYLIGYPFLEKSNGPYLAQFLNYLRLASDKAAQGSGRQGHSTGDTAFIDLTNAATAKTMDRLNYYSTAISIACNATVSTDSVFGDHTVRTLDLSKLMNITNVRNLLPSFQKDDLTAPGIWPDPTFGGVVTPGIPQGFVKLYYHDFEKAY